MPKEESSTRTVVITLVSALLGGLIALSSDLVKSYYEHRHDKENVTKAILVETRELTHQIIIQRNWWRNSVDPQQELQPLVAFNTQVFDQHVDKIDLLDPDLAQKVAEFYYQGHFINDFQKLKESYVSPAQNRLEFYCRYDRILSTHLEERGFEPPEKSPFNKYYQDYGIPQLPPVAPVAAPNPVCDRLPPSAKE